MRVKGITPQDLEAYGICDAHDVVYNPENTLLIKEARARNCRVITGVDMFVRQACMQFRLFTDQEGPADLMRDIIKRATAAAKYAEERREEREEGPEEREDEE